MKNSRAKPADFALDSRTNSANGQQGLLCHKKITFSTQAQSDEEQSSRQVFNARDNISLSSVETLPKTFRKDSAQYGQNEIVYEEKQTVRNQEDKTCDQLTDKQAWLNAMRFDYFFQTLQDHPEEIKPYIPSPKQLAQIYLYDDPQEQLPLLSRKKVKDNDWGCHLRKKQSDNAPERRKSTRIEQLQEKQRIQTQMKQMRSSYYRGRYRYSILSVGFRLSFLEANCFTYSDYQSQMIDNIKKYPGLYWQSQLQKQQHFQKKLMDLQSRVVRTEQK